MSGQQLVRASRDGDQFHYLWAARRCLRLLSPSPSLVAITIEGAAPSEVGSGDQIDDGDELIDVAEYEGSEDLSSASCIRYIQLKHSTLRTTLPWTPSELKATLAGWAQRYTEIEKRFPGLIVAQKVEFWFVSNRAVGENILECIADCAHDGPNRHVQILGKLGDATKLAGTTLSAFCRLLRFEGTQDDYWSQRNLLFQDLSGYLPGSDATAPTQLKELVARKALSESTRGNTITRSDVLRAIQTDEDELFPARPQMEALNNVVTREQERDLIEQIVQANGTPVIVHAAGGVGKSIFATHIERGLPVDSCCIVYDCFGRGRWRNQSAYRHRHKDALVEIANELAAKGLCHPLIPSATADPPRYMKAFLHRVKQSVASLRGRDPGALLCIVIDAADNAQMAAQETGELRSFVPDLLREELPEGVRLVALCRTHRQTLLNAPNQSVSLELRPFSLSETGTNLRLVFPDAEDNDVLEFHRLTSHNPRVQAMALTWGAPLDQTLRNLGPDPTTVETAIEKLLNDSIDRLIDAGGPIEQDAIERICTGLAVLRPLVPISVLARMSGVHEAAIKSFAFDLKRPLLVTGDMLQFIDEPSETWFRDRFRPSGEGLAGFVMRLKPLGPSSAYVASTLPQLMLEAGQFDELVALALSSSGLPEEPIQRRDVEVRRLQFALKASLRIKQYATAAKLALKAGGEAAGNEREAALFQGNTDLAAQILDSDQIQEIASRRLSGTEWVGSHFAYEAGLLSGRPELIGEARSKLRMAMDWVLNWGALPKEVRRQEPLTDIDNAELALAHLNIDGPVGCAAYLRRWRPREVSFRVGRILARRLGDLGRYQEMNDIAVAADSNLHLVLAFTLELREVHRTPPKTVVERVIGGALSWLRVPKLKNAPIWDEAEVAVRTVTAIVDAALELSVCSHVDLARILTRVLPDVPPHGWSSHHGHTRFPLLRAYALRAALADKPLVLKDLASPEISKELDNQSGSSRSREAREFKEDVGALLPWHSVWAGTVTGRIPAAEFPAAIEKARKDSRAAESYYGSESHTNDEISRVWLDSIARSSSTDPSVIAGFNAWIGALQRPLFTTTLTHLARIAARVPALQVHARKYASSSFAILKPLREEADEKARAYTDLARAVFALSRHEADEYFHEAVIVVGRIGDENLHRWGAMLDLAVAAADPNAPVAETAYRLSRAAELTYEYVVRDKYFDWNQTVEAISALCPASSLAVLSRWRDRAFGWSARLLPVAVNYLVDHGGLDARTGLALTCFRGSWDYSRMLDRALNACESQPAKEVAAAHFMSYMVIESHGVKTWRQLRDTLGRHDLSTDDVDKRIEFAVQEHGVRDQSSGSSWLAGERGDGRDWSSVFSEVDLSAAQGLAIAYRRFLSHPPPFYRDAFFAEVCHRISVGREAELIAALEDVPELSLYDLRTFLEQIPESWKNSLAVRKSLSSTLKTFLRRHCLEIGSGRNDEPFPFQLANDLAGLTQYEASSILLEELGSVTESFGMHRLFSVVGVLAKRLSRREALDALTFGLDLFEATLQAEDGDGPWSPALAPPQDLGAAVAGYVWAGLASPRSTMRWQAAHVVRALSTLGRTASIDGLISIARTGVDGAFADARLFFYRLHAHQWLMIALARAAKDSATALSAHEEFIVHAALSGPAHVLIRGFAASAALALYSHGVSPADPGLPGCLESVNFSRFAPIQSKRYGPRRSEGRRRIDESDEDRFNFNMDIDAYWFDPLGDCFGASRPEVAAAARDVIRRDWSYPAANGWDKDERSRRGFFRDCETTHSHGSYPRSDDLSFYLSYHALMTVAGQWLDTRPLHVDPDSPWHGFATWMARHGLTRSDGDWLADRRDPGPLERPPWCDEKEDVHWRWSIARRDFDRLLIRTDGNLNLWGRWKHIGGQRVESVEISSALVSRTRSESLMRAMQTSGANEFALPRVSNDDELEINTAEYRLQAWIDASYSDGRLDARDPWAGEIEYPPVLPAKYVIDCMHLWSDAEGREFSVGASPEAPVVLWSTVWGEARGQYDDDDDGERNDGKRLHASPGFVTELLRRLDRDLIIKVEIERYFVRRRYEGRGYELGYCPNSARIFLARPDGSLVAI
jgi:hypothetical protein